VKWTLNGPTHRQNDWLYQVDGDASFYGASGTIPAGQQSTLVVTHWVNQCTSGRTNSQLFSVLVNNATVASFTFTY
jgi:hypothetical protein